MIHRITRSTRRMRVLSFAAALLLAGASSSLAAEVGPEMAPFEPAGAVVAPDISVARMAGTSNALLSWEHAGENEGYQVWRGTAPYFEPPDEGGQIWYTSAASCGAPCYFNIPDDGLDYYPADGTLPAVLVIGATTTNFFWVVRGQNGESVSGNSNRVGEFDFALVPGG